ncbi:MAG TPA: twin-arginine translocation signal domain-containing protein [Candidatus Dormibacteraeota bacterium]|nr:twin-arginine translocation signal domain-containing protein [Candidatus Dormibacteraeota bacterium]
MGREKRRHQSPDDSRRDFLKTAGMAAGATLMGGSLWANGRPELVANPQFAAFPRIQNDWMMTPDQIRNWAYLKSQWGPTWAGGVGWQQFTNFLIEQIPERGGIDLDTVDIPYKHYIVDDWPDPSTHRYGSGVEVLNLVSGGVPVPVVASYGETSGFTPPEGITAPMLYYDFANPPGDEQIAGKILVVPPLPYPDPPYTDAFLGPYAMNDYEFRSPGKWYPMYEPVPASVASSYHSRWCWMQSMEAAGIAMKGHAAGMVVVYDLSPGAAFGLTQRALYTTKGKAIGGNVPGKDFIYVNCPTLCLDRVNGAKVLDNAKAGKSATLTLRARFQDDMSKAFVCYLPGKHYGTPLDEQIMLATHTDAMSLVEEVGGLGMLAVMSYFNHIPRAERPRTLAFYFDGRHFMPGGESAWAAYDYYLPHPERLKPIVATIGMEHMGGRQTVETGPGGNEYRYSDELPENGGVITSFIDLYNNNIWLIETLAKAVTDNHWPRVDAKSGFQRAPEMPEAGNLREQNSIPATIENYQPGVNGGFQGQVYSPMNKGRMFHIPGIGLAADWPGAWTQTYSQIDTEAGPSGFDADYFMRQIGGLSQMTGEFMIVKPVVIDLGWGDLKSAIIKLADSDFVTRHHAAEQRQRLVDQYVAAFRKVEAASLPEARSTLKELAANVSSWVARDKQDSLSALVDGQISKLS